MSNRLSIVFVLALVAGAVFYLVSLNASAYTLAPSLTNHDSSRVLVEVQKISASRYVMRFGGHLYDAVHSEKCSNDEEELPPGVDLDSIEPVPVLQFPNDPEKARLIGVVHRAHLFDVHHLRRCDHEWCQKTDR